MVTSPGRETRAARKAVLLVVAGLFAQRWELFRRSRNQADLTRVNGEMRASLEAERRRADGLAKELARTRAEFDRTLARVNERHELAEQREALLERERAQVAMLEEMHRSHDDFIALAGHELRTPLTVIQGYAEHLLDDPATTPEQAQQLEIVVRRARSMSDLIDDLFDLAKLDAPLSALAFAPVGLHVVAEESVKAHEPLARQLDLTFRTALAPVHVVGDHDRLRRMCDKLLDNAVQYSRPGGQVTVSVGLEEQDAVLIVSDQGIGIPADEVPRVFERLYRGSNATNVGIPGAGLGLSIALATAEGLGGTATAGNGDDGGAVFTIRVPAHEVSGTTEDR